MNTLAIIQLLPILSAMSPIVRGAAAGALAGSIVLCRARVRGLRVVPWAVAAAWSTLGAVVAALCVLLSLLR